MAPPAGVRAGRGAALRRGAAGGGGARGRRARGGPGGAGGRVAGNAAHGRARGRAGPRGDAAAAPLGRAGGPRRRRCTRLAGARGEAGGPRPVPGRQHLRRRAARVTREPLVGHTRWGVGVAHGGVSVEYRVQRRPRAYPRSRAGTRTAPSRSPGGAEAAVFRGAPRNPRQPFGVSSAVRNHNPSLQRSHENLQSVAELQGLRAGRLGAGRR